MRLDDGVSVMSIARTEREEETDEEAENSEEVIQEVLTFLTDWLVHHILETDKKIAE